MHCKPAHHFSLFIRDLNDSRERRVFFLDTLSEDERADFLAYERSVDRYTASHYQKAPKGLAQFAYTIVIMVINTLIIHN